MMKYVGKASARLLALGVVLFLISSCSQNEDDKHVDPTSLHVSLGASPQTLDPHLFSGVPAMHVISALSERLVTLNLDTFEVEPALAEHWEVSEDGLRYEFNLRKDAKWSNGDPVTAQDIVNSFQRAMHPNIGWHFATDFYFIVGAEAFHSGDETDPNTIGVHATDKHTVVFLLERPSPLFLKQLSASNFAPLHKASIEKIGSFFDPATNWTQGGKYVSNGPFMLSSWEINKLIVLTKNPHYRDAASVKLERVLVYPLENELADERAFRSGQVQLVLGGRIPSEKVAGYRKERPNNIVTVNNYATYFYLLNVEHPPLDDVRVRQALAHAIDRHAIVTHITKAGEEVATTLNPPATPNYQQIKKLDYDPELARQLLADAGYPGGEGFPSIPIIYNTAENHRKVALAIQQMWKDNLGIGVSLENQEWKVFLSTRKSHQYAIARAGSISDLGDPLDFLESYKTGHGMNNTGWSNLDYDALVAEAASTIDDEARLRLLTEAENVLLDEMPLIPIYYYAQTFLIADEVKGVKFNALSRFRFQDIYIDTKQDQ